LAENATDLTNGSEELKEIPGVKPATLVSEEERGHLKQHYHERNPGSAAV
jgi:hypothetical protein